MASFPAMDEEAILKEYRPRLLYFILKQVRDRAVAEELTQDALMIFVQATRQDKIRDLSRPGAFIFGVANRLILRYRSDNPSGMAPSESTADAESWEFHPEAQLLLEEKRSGVRRAMELLSGPDREILYHSFVEEHGLEHIADRLGIPYAAARKRKSRAVMRLRDIFTKLSQKDRS